MTVNGWRIMWVLAVYDCPVSTPEERKRYQQFHNLLLEENFSMEQFSVYLRHFPTMAAAEAEISKIGRRVPPNAKAAFFLLTDKQYSMTREFLGPRTIKKEPPKQLQIELF